ncbi:hypothetical protein OGATHE_001604 [Ogataea polymorpha]|uniref:Uncharacterized protein n=1 Tax=Ogataea polymorpha TaxID=460523 RepID=A0A9P8PPP9_9ASCO|nr:hypothetical protein OGATHE_001604 [Ogataea polymorpha]
MDAALYKNGFCVSMYGESWYPRMFERRISESSSAVNTTIKFCSERFWTVLNVAKEQPITVWLASELMTVTSKLYVPKGEW